MASAAENEARLFSATSLNRNVSFFSNTSAWTFYILAVAVLRWAAYAFLPHDIFDTAAQWTIVHLVHGLVCDAATTPVLALVSLDRAASAESKLCETPHFAADFRGAASEHRQPRLE